MNAFLRYRSVDLACSAQLRRGAFVVLLVCACGGSGPPTLGASPDQTARDNRAVLALVRQVLQADASGFRADSLYITGASVIANAVQRNQPPRLAGIGVDGTVVITELTGEVHPNVAWALASYRWSSEDGSITETARATFVLERSLDLSGWRVRHVHSSVILPWEGPG